MLRKWELQPGMGEAILAGIGQDVRERRQIGPSVTMMDLIAQAHEATADVLHAENMELVADADERALEALAGEYEGAEYAQRSQAEDMRARIGEARRIAGKEHLGNIPQWRFRLEVLEAGVVEFKKMGAAGGGNKAKDSGILKPGEVIQGLSGAVGLITSAPESGGELIYDFPGDVRRPWHIRQCMHVTGLVSVETGEPNVDLQVLMKR